MDQGPPQGPHFKLAVCKDPFPNETELTGTGGETCMSDFRWGRHAARDTPRACHFSSPPRRLSQPSPFLPWTLKTRFPSSVCLSQRPASSPQALPGPPRHSACAPAPEGSLRHPPALGRQVAGGPHADVRADEW